METYYQIKVRGGLMHATNGPPYRFKTYKEAKDTVSMCYGLSSLDKDVEIVEIQEVKND